MRTSIPSKRFLLALQHWYAQQDWAGAMQHASREPASPCKILPSKSYHSSWCATQGWARTARWSRPTPTRGQGGRGDDREGVPDLLPLPVITTRGNNVYGPHQFPEKSVPKFMLLALRGERLPIHGDGARASARVPSTTLLVPDSCSRARSTCSY